MDKKLLVLLVAFSQRLHERQTYLERCKDTPCPNAELVASPAETVASICEELDTLIAYFIVDNTVPPVPNMGRPLVNHLNREIARRKAIAQWVLVDNVPSSEAGQERATTD